MRKKLIVLYDPLLIMVLLLFFFGSCKKDDDNEGGIQLPILSTADVTNIGQITAQSGGVITTDAGFAVSARGVCWNTSGNPTINDNKTEDGLGAGSYTSKLTGLELGTNYYVRAYATNSQGTAYGSTMVFETLGSTFTDSRDGNVYKMVTIGDQIWMAENFRYLPSVVDPATGSSTTPYYYVNSYYGTNVTEAQATGNYATYGVLYNWTAALDACPAGWHLPTDEEWTEIENYLADNGYNYDGTTGGGRVKVAKAMAAASGWSSSSNNGAAGNNDYDNYRNKSGFTALPGGFRTGYGTFGGIGGFGIWWSATENFSNIAWFRGMGYDKSYVYRDGSYEGSGYSVRCLRD